MDIIDSRVIEIARRRLEGTPNALADFTQDYKLASKAPNEAEPGSRPRIIYPQNLETIAAEAIATGDFDAVDREIEAMVGQWAAQYVGANSGEPKGTRAGAKNKAPMIGALKMLGVLNDPLALKQAQRQAEEVDATMQAALEAQKTIEGWKLSPEEKEVMENIFAPKEGEGQKVMDIFDEIERQAMPAAIDQALAEFEAAEHLARMEAKRAEIQAAKGAEIYQAEMMKLKAQQDFANQLEWVTTPQPEVPAVPQAGEGRPPRELDGGGNAEKNEGPFVAPGVKPDLLAVEMVRVGNRLWRKLARMPSALEVWQEMLQSAAELDLDRDVKDGRDVLRFETRQGPSKPITFTIFKQRYSKYIQS
jgi:hypothetical protein